MRILVLGGTRFVGRHLVEAALARGHEVTVLHRGRHGADLFAGLDRRLGDRDAAGGLAALAVGDWDVTLDTCAYSGNQVAALAGALGGRGGRYVLVSTVSVYDRPPLGYREGAPLLPLGGGVAAREHLYGSRKAAAEGVARARFGADVLIVRPTYVVGPHDYSGRFPYWVGRLARGGGVLAPGPAAAPIQLVDGRDLASFVLRCVERGVGGTFHVAGPATPLSWGALLESVAATVAPAGTSLHWVDRGFLASRGLGSRDLPLWSPDDAERRWLTADPALAFEAGLELRPLGETIADTAAWLRGGRAASSVGLESGHERALLASWAAERSGPRGGGSLA
ncbi:MAG: NAD-dependent epimerase/dehydratase family protein [Acidimicrobiia bacterium]|nr:NAD-dependent epimerase/dehydratase family protein [Acidimicrobiia bacterium]